MSKQEEYLKVLREQLGPVVDIDADTVIDEQGSVRFENLSAPEVQHLRPTGMTQGESGGQFYADLYDELADEAGFDEVYRTGEQGYYGRDLGGKKHPETDQKFSDKLFFEGLASPVNAEQQELYDMGVFARAFPQEIGVEEDTVWSRARTKQEEFNKDRLGGFKVLALNEAQKAEYDAFYGESYSPFISHDVQYRHEGRDIHNVANSNFKTGWLVGWGSIKESAAEGLSVLGDIIGSERLYAAGQENAAFVAYENAKLPHFVNDISTIENMSDFGDWVAGITGVALPYMLGIIGTVAAGTVVAGTAPVWGSAGGLAALFTGGAIASAPWVWIYSGETYGHMKGDMDQKNAGIALASGSFMTLMDRLGLKGLLKASTGLKQDALEQVAKIYSTKKGVTLDVARKRVGAEVGKLKTDILADIGTIATLQMSKSVLAKNIAQRTSVGMAVESGTEFLQESSGFLLGHLGTHDDIRGEMDWDEYKRIAINATAGGLVLGGTIAGTTSTYTNLQGFSKLKRDVGPVPQDKDYVGGTLDENMNYFLNEPEPDFVGPEQVILGPDGKPARKQKPREEGESGAQSWANRDAQAEAEEAYKAGAKEDTSKTRGGTKSLWQNIKEFPKRFTQKIGSYWQERVFKDADPETKRLYATIASLAGMAKKSFMQSLDIGGMKRQLFQKYNFEIDELQARLNTLLGVGVRGRTSEEATAIFLEYLEAKRNNEEMNPAHKALEEQLEQLRLDLGGQIDGTLGITDNFYKDITALLANEPGAKHGYKPFWFQDSARLKIAEVLKDKNGFIKKLMDANWTKEEAESFYDYLESGPMGYDKSQLRELGFKNFPSRSMKQSKDILTTIFGEDSKFLETDPFQRAKENFQEQTNYAIDRKYLGLDGIKLKKLLLMLKDRMGDRWDNRIMTNFLDSVAASRGDYRRMSNKKIERTIGHITFFNTFSHLDLSMLASLPEAALVLMGATRDKRLMELFQLGVNDFARKNLIEAGHAWSYINPKSGVTRQEYTRNLADFYRYGYGGSTHGAIGQVGIDDAVYKASKIKEFAMKTFFMANLLKVYTDTTRVARLSLANDAIFGDLEIIAMFPRGSEGRSSGLFHDAFERLRDLNIDPDRLALKYDKVVRVARAMLNEGGDLSQTEQLYENILALDSVDPDGGDFINDMDIARMTWVDNAIAHPEAMNRPIWYSNPYYRLFTQYNGFMSVFTAHILPRIWRSIKQGDPTARYSTVAIGATMIMLAFLSQAMKDEWRYGGRPGWLNEKGFYQRGIASSGLLGTPERILGAISPIYDASKKHWETTPEWLLGRAGHTIEELLGPTYAHGEQIAKMFLNHLEGDKDRRNMYLSREIPFLGKNKDFKEWNLGRGDINLESALKRTLPFN